MGELEDAGELFCLTDDQAVVDKYREIVGWVQAGSQFLPEAKVEFAQSPDGWLIPYAKATGNILVTHEVLAKDARRNVPIPNGCEALGVDYTDTFEMLRDLRDRFTWQPPA